MLSLPLLTFPQVNICSVWSGSENHIWLYSGLFRALRHQRVVFYHNWQLQLLHFAFGMCRLLSPTGSMGRPIRSLIADESNRLNSLQISTRPSLPTHTPITPPLKVSLQIYHHFLSLGITPKGVGGDLPPKGAFILSLSSLMTCTNGKLKSQLTSTVAVGFVFVQWLFYRIYDGCN